MQIENCTPHEVNIYNEENILVIRFPPGKKVARTPKAFEEGFIECAVFKNLKPNTVSIPLKCLHLYSPLNIPLPEENTIYIVSASVAKILPYRTDLYYPSDLVKNEKGDVIGCKSLTRIQVKRR